MLESSETVLKVVKTTPQYWRATFNSPPLNLWAAEQYEAFGNLLTDLENDKEVRVIVFDSAAEGYFIAHFDLEKGPTIPKTTALKWPFMVRRLAKLSVVSIAEVRGRTRGIGSEFILACDMRFASREKAIFAQLEVGCGALPGGGGIEWLPRLVGRSRALEIILGSEDYNAEVAERYGWINRAIADAELSAFVDNYARRLAGFDTAPLAKAKSLVNARTGLPSLIQLMMSIFAFVSLLKLPQTVARLGKLFTLGLQKDGDTERNLGRAIGELNLPKAN